MANDSKPRTVDSFTMLHKNGLAAQEIARDILTLGPEGRLPTTEEYAERLGIGWGTVRKALEFLSLNGAAEVKARGHQGTYVVNRDLPRLWEVAGFGPIVGSLPLPNSREFQGLASGIREEAERHHFALSLTFSHGAQVRLDSLINGRVDFVVASCMFAQQAMSMHPTIMEVFDLGPSSYYADGSVVILTSTSIDSLDEIKRIGIDRSSSDHTALTEAEFDGERLVEMPYPLLPEAIQNGEIDGAIWHSTMLVASLAAMDLQVHPLRQNAAETVSGRMSNASVLARSHSPSETVLKQWKSSEIRRVQEAVTERRQLPRY